MTDPDIHKLDAGGKYPLHHAADAQDLNALKALVAWGCDPLQQTADGETAFDIALDHGQFEMCTYLMSFEPAFDPRPNGYNALDYPAM